MIEKIQYYFYIFINDIAQIKCTFIRNNKLWLVSLISTNDVSEKPFFHPFIYT